jgi:hypothetical protein
VRVEGYGFLPDAEVSISFGERPTIATANTSPGGTFSTHFYVDTQPPGRVQSLQALVLMLQQHILRFFLSIVSLAMLGMKQETVSLVSTFT